MIFFFYIHRSQLCPEICYLVVQLFLFKACGFLNLPVYSGNPRLCIFYFCLKAKNDFFYSCNFLLFSFFGGQGLLCWLSAFLFLLQVFYISEPAVSLFPGCSGKLSFP